MKKKIIIILTIIVIVIIGLLFLSTGGARSDVYLQDFNLDEECNKMTLKVGVFSSAGYVRDLKVKQGGDNKYITFYSTFGINNKNGSKDTFDIELNKSAVEIYFYTGEKGYKKVLEKNEETGEWRKVVEKTYK